MISLILLLIVMGVLLWCFTLGIKALSMNETLRQIILALVYLAAFLYALQAVATVFQLNIHVPILR